MLGHAEYSCMLMDTLNCAYSELNQADWRSSFHVKGDHMITLFDTNNAKTFSELDAALKKDVDFKFGHWTSWGYHDCESVVVGCGKGTVKRHRKMADGSSELESRACEWKTPAGVPVECETPVEEDFVGDGHGWMHWGEWTTCSATCKTGKRRRFRACGTCDKPTLRGEHRGLCNADDISSNNPTPFYLHKDKKDHCSKGDESEEENCDGGICIPGSNGKWKTGQVPFKVKYMWSLKPADTRSNDESEFEGGCIDYTSAYKKFNLDSQAKDGFHYPAATFAECLRICQVKERENCASVTFFPSTKNGKTSGAKASKFYGTDENGDELYNCFLHSRRCHEDAEFRDADWLAKNTQLTGQDKAKSWYAFKDLCSTPIYKSMCSYQGTFYQTQCNSKGDKGFPNTDVCSCPMSGDKFTSLRTWGNPTGKMEYNASKGKLEKIKFAQLPLRYNPGVYDKKFKTGTTEDYENTMREGKMSCHSKSTYLTQKINIISVR